MTDQDIFFFIEQTGALLRDDHFVYTSGKHGSAYLNKDAIYPHTELTSKLCEEIAVRAHAAGVSVDAVVGPALGGIILSQWVAFHLSKLLGREVLGVYTEKTPENGQRFTRGYDALVRGQKVLVVEDIMTTGGSVRKVVDAVSAAGGNVLHAFALLNRNPEVVTAQLIGCPLSSLVVLPLEAWDPADCALCKRGVPINTTVGKGKEVKK